MHFIIQICIGFCRGELLEQFSQQNIFIVEERLHSYPKGELHSHALLRLELIELPAETKHLKKKN